MAIHNSNLALQCRQRRKHELHQDVRPRRDRGCGINCIPRCRVGHRGNHGALLGGGSTVNSGATITSSLTSGTSALLTDTSGETADTCKGSTVGVTTTNTTDSPVAGFISTLFWSSCTWTTESLTNGNLAITKNAGTNDGTVTGTGSRVTVMVLGFLHCVYGTGEGTHLGTLDGVSSGNATLAINATIQLREGKFCPESIKWVANYVVTSPTALNVGS